MYEFICDRVCVEGSLTFAAFTDLFNLAFLWAN